MGEQHGFIMEEQIEVRFGNYQLVKRIDVGGMGEVYLAHQLTAFGRAVAIKIIRSDLAHDMTARARFLREAEVSAHLKHEHILPLFDFGEAEGRLFLVTPYIEGGTLAKRLRDSGPIPLPEVRALFVPLVQAVAYIHRRGVIHRDLKPTNIMLDREDGEVYVRLIDFGIASLQGQSASPPLTMAGHEMGTVAYMAPERLSGVAAPSNDIFSLGVILHQMLTGRIPTATPSPTSSAPRAPEPLARVVRRGIAANPAERYATADELLKAFERAYQQAVQEPPPFSPLPERPPATPVFSGNTAQEQVVSAARAERVALAQAGEVAVPPSASANAPAPPRFTPEDYSAPTTAFRPSASRHTTQTMPPRQHATGSRRKSPMLLLASATTILILLVIAGVLYDGYQIVAGANVSINFTPRSNVLSQVFTFQANPNVHSVNTSQAIIPAHVLTLSQNAQQTGNTTGQTNCIFPGFGCQAAVSPDDVETLKEQIAPGLQQNISQALQSQITAAHGTQFGPVQFSISSISTNPQVGALSKTVTVALTEQGSVGYAANADVTGLVRQMLAHTATSQLGQGYQIVPASITIGSVALQAVNASNGVSTLKVPAGAIARYQFSSAQLQTLSTSLAGKSLRQAETILQHQPGIDPASVKIHFSSGNTGQNMPSDPQRITFIPLNPTSQATISLTPVAGITPTPTATPAPSPTPNDNGDNGNNGN